MQSLSRSLATLRIGTARIAAVPQVQTRLIHTTPNLERRARDYFGHRQEQGRWVPGKRPHRGPGGGVPKKNWHQNNEDTGKGKFSDARKRIATFRTEPRYATDCKLPRLLYQRPCFTGAQCYFSVYDVKEA